MTTDRKSVLIRMADHFGMEPAPFEQTLRATVVPANCSKEQFAAFLLVADKYGLNPVTKEIYAFPTKGGGIQPIVGVDGWMRIINDHPQMDGLEFKDIIQGGELIAITAKIYRKDRSHPTEVTEYMTECVRDTTTWKQWPARMLRHKAAIQAARYAFGFSGIVEPDEYERGVGAHPLVSKSAYRARQDGDWQGMISEMDQAKTAEDLESWNAANQERIGILPKNWQEHLREEYERRIAKLQAPVEPKKRGRPRKERTEPYGGSVKQQLQASIDKEDAETVEPIDEIPEEGGGSLVEDPDAYLDQLDSQLSTAKTVDDVNDVWEEYKLVMPNLFPPDREKADALFDKHQTRVEGEK